MTNHAGPEGKIFLTWFHT